MSEAIAPLASRSPQSVAVDNLLRRQLKIGNPSDPLQVATGLLALYPDTADDMFRERAGLNYGAADLPRSSANGKSGAASAAQGELALALDYLDRDIQTLTTSSELKEVDVELKGWGRAVSQAASEGLAAAALALDPVQSDRAMAQRRILGDYARLARYVGAASADSNPLFRHFAQSCDVMASLILVAIGDGLAANGITRSTALIRVSASELQSRRNAVIQAFRTLTGTALVPNGQDEYPRGLEAYRILTRQLELAGQSDLRTLLDETSLAAELDQVVDLAVGANPNGLRELSSASMIVIDRLSRLVNACRAFDLAPAETVAWGTPDAPPLVYFASALQMFVDAFTVTTGGRLLFIARPPLLAYGLYGSAGPDGATQRLIQLTLARGAAAEQADGFAYSASGQDAVMRAVVLDYLLYRLDRAIDFYAVGYRPGGHSEPEHRAAALGYTLTPILEHLATDTGRTVRVGDRLIAALTAVRQELLNPDLVPEENILKPDGAILEERLVPTHQGIVLDELNSSYFAEKQLERLVQSLGLRFFSSSFFGDGPHTVCGYIKAAMGRFGVAPAAPGSIVIPPDMSSSLAALAYNWPQRRHGVRT